MERVEGALKSSIRPEMAVKSTQQALVDDVWTVNGQSGVSGDDFFVDDLLDFSNGGIEDGFIKEEHEEEEEEEDKGCVSVSPQEKDNSNPSSTFSVKDALASVPASELSVPADDLADLEWLSHFVEDSFSEFSLSYPTGNITGKLNAHTENRSEPENPVYRKPCFVTRFPAKARSKRTRTGGRVWSLGSPSVTESSSTSSSSSSTSHSSPWLIYTNTTQNVDSFYSVGKPPAKKHKKKPPTEAGGGAPPPRRCSHCHVQKTPQWRSGPLGAKTLCNACGVRFKSGRLLPEYRPACSPTFSSDVHSNNHRKVLEMRRKKETGRPDSGFAPAVPSF